MRKDDPTRRQVLAAGASLAGLSACQIPPIDAPPAIAVTGAQWFNGSGFEPRTGYSAHEGFEASFLALEANPLSDWSAINRIRLRFKQGVELA